ncbi:hypothetical protein BGX21_007017, partial [Mortierella sp. AD011]
IDGSDVACSDEWPTTLRGIHLKLYRFIESKIKGVSPMAKIVEKDVFVAMSGIVNTRMDNARDVFGTDIVDQIKAKCLRPAMDKPSEDLQSVLAPLAEAYRSGGLEGLLDEVEIAIGAEAMARRERSPNPLKRKILDAQRS